MRSCSGPSSPSATKTPLVLVERHGPMVLGVCRRVLGNVHDAEDAFQATFLLLARKSASIRQRAAVANWLYGVAYRTALAARRAAGRRSAKEKQVKEMPHLPATPEDTWQELQPLLDRELESLADKYRLPVVLCDLEGRTRKETARQLRIPEGTLSNRLAAARKMLAKRLTRHGLTLAGGALAAILAQNSASAGVSVSLVGSTVKAASAIASGQATAGLISPTVVALFKGALKAMFLTKLKNALAVLIVVSLIAYGGGLLSFQAVGAQEDKGGLLAGAGTAKDHKAAPILSAPLDISARAALDESAEQQLKIAAEKLKAVTDEQTRKEAVKEVENAIKAVEALLRKDRQDRKTAYEKPKRVSLVLSKASAERRDKDVLFRCEAILDNATGKELSWQTSFVSTFPGLGLVVTDKDGRELAQEFSSQQSTGDYIVPILSNYVLKQGNTPVRLVFAVELPREVKVVKVRLLGALPGSNYKHLLSSDTLELTLRIPEGVAPASNSPAGHLRGVIEKVDPKDPLLVQISLGSDARLQKGHMLEVFRLQPRPEYLGTLRVVSVQADKSVCTQVASKISGKTQRLQVGDQVASQLTPAARP
jgi:RNA polymerase sigma factor (sigma-70 family)